MHWPTGWTEGVNIVKYRRCCSRSCNAGPAALIEAREREELQHVAAAGCPPGGESGTRQLPIPFVREHLPRRSKDANDADIVVIYIHMLTYTCLHTHSHIRAYTHFMSMQRWARNSTFFKWCRCTGISALCYEHQLANF